MRVQTIHRTSDGREFGGHEFEAAQAWQRYLNELAAGHEVQPPDLSGIPTGPQMPKK